MVRKVKKSNIKIKEKREKRIIKLNLEKRDILFLLTMRMYRGIFSNS